MADARQAMLGRCVLLAAGLLLAAPVELQALDIAAPPTYGTVELSAGFIPGDT